MLHGGELSWLLILAQGQWLAGAALQLPVQKPHNLDLTLVWSLCSLACCRYALRSCFYSFTAVFGFSLAGITTADKAKTLSCSCLEKLLWSEFSSGELIQTCISASFIRVFIFLWLAAGCNNKPVLYVAPVAGGVQGYENKVASITFVGAAPQWELRGKQTFLDAFKHPLSLEVWKSWL